MNNNKKNTQVLVTLIICIVSIITLSISLLVAFFIKPGSNDGGINNGKTTIVDTTVTETTTEEITTEEITYEVSLMMVGDILAHPAILRTATQSDGTYNYDYMFKDILDYVDAADISVINLESMICGEQYGYDYPGYPVFNCPDALGHSIASAGFNVVLAAHNHSFDHQLDGLLYCYNFWTENYPDITLLGIHEDTATEHDIILVEVNNITFAMLNYTYSHNWATISTSVIGHLNLLCAYDPDTYYIDYNTIEPSVLEDIKAADELADVVIVFPHWGTEYTTTPTAQEVAFAKLMTEAGADLILGGHPHVIQPIEWIEADNGNKCLCYYSLGNFVSTQATSITQLEGMAIVKFTKTGDEVVVGADGTGVIPIVNHWEDDSAGNSWIKGIYKLSDYTEELAAKHGLHNHYPNDSSANITKAYLDQVANDVFGDWILE